MKNILALILVIGLSISLNAQTVLFLDAGHGGKDPGGIAASGVTEAEINQLFVKEIKELAEAKGMKVVLLSKSDTYISLKERVGQANDYKLEKGQKAILLSIHANFSPADPLKKGKEVLVMRKEERSKGSMELANKFSKALDAPILEKGLTILRQANMPAVMIETGYLSNEQDAIDLTTPDMRTVLVRKIVATLTQ